MWNHKIGMRAAVVCVRHVLKINDTCIATSGCYLTISALGELTKSTLSYMPSRYIRYNFTQTQNHVGDHHYLACSSTQTSSVSRDSGVVVIGVLLFFL